MIAATAAIEANTAAVRNLSAVLSKPLAAITGTPDPAAQLVWIEASISKCRLAVALAGKAKRAWMHMTLVGETGPSPVAVFPGVRGYVVQYGKTIAADASGAVKPQRLTKVKVCARTLLAALEQAKAALEAPPTP